MKKPTTGVVQVTVTMDSVKLEWSEKLKYLRCYLGIVCVLDTGIKKPTAICITTTKVRDISVD